MKDMKNEGAVALAKLSVAKRFGNMTKEEISEHMRNIAKKPRGKRKSKKNLHE